MLLGWQQMRPPGLPCSPELDVTSPTSVTVRIRENVAHHQTHPIITKYRGESTSNTLIILLNWQKMNPQMWPLLSERIQVWGLD